MTNYKKMSASELIAVVTAGLGTTEETDLESDLANRQECKSHLRLEFVRAGEGCWETKKDLCACDAFAALLAGQICSTVANNSEAGLSLHTGIVLDNKSFCLTSEKLLFAQGIVHAFLAG